MRGKAKCEEGEVLEDRKIEETLGNSLGTGSPRKAIIPKASMTLQGCLGGGSNGLSFVRWADPGASGPG